MKKRTWAILLSLLLVCVIWFAYSEVAGQIRHKQRLEMISERVGSEPDMDSIHQAIIGSFEPGMTRDEVYDKIVRIDPSLKDSLGSKSFRCNENDCEEYLHFFSEQFGNRFGVGFVYSLDNELERILFLSW